MDTCTQGDIQSLRFPGIEELSSGISRVLIYQLYFPKIQCDSRYVVYPFLFVPLAA